MLLARAGCSAQGAINNFGNDFKFGLLRDPSVGGGKSRAFAWTREFCAQDDDADGFSNGDELGDGCCAWQGRDSDLLFYDTLVGVARNISNPSSDISMTPRPQCGGGGPPAAPAYYVANVAATTLTLAWAANPAATACTCEYSATVTYALSAYAAATVTANVRGDAPALQLCGLPPGAAVNLSLVGINRDGRSDRFVDAPLLTVQMLPTPPAGAAPAAAAACTPYAPQDVAGGGAPYYTIYIDSIPALGGFSNAAPGLTAGGMLAPDEPTVGAVWAAVPLCLLVAAAMALQATTAGCCCLPCGGPAARRSRACCGAYRFLCVCCCDAFAAAAATHLRDPLYNMTSFKRGAACCARATSPACRARLRLGYWLDFTQSSRAFSVSVGVSLAAVAVCWALSTTWYAQHMLYSPAQVAGAVYRGAGYALALCFGVQMLPVTRWSPWMHLAGVSFERGIMWHRWVGTASLLLGAVHGVGLAVEYGLNSPLGVAYLFRWSTDLPVNPLPGTIAGFALLALGATAWGPVRRGYYELFLLGHALYPAIFALGVVHTVLSETPTLPLLLPGLVLLGFDHAAMLADLLLRPTHVRRAVVPAETDARGDPLTQPTLVFLECHKGAVFGWRWLDALWPFVYAPGQYMVLLVPAVSLIPHPFSIASAPDPVRPGHFTICVRAMAGSSSYTSLLATTAFEASRCAALAEGAARDDEDGGGEDGADAMAREDRRDNTPMPGSPPSPRRANKSSGAAAGGSGASRRDRISFARKVRMSLNPFAKAAGSSLSTKTPQSLGAATTSSPPGSPSLNGMGLGLGDEAGDGSGMGLEMSLTSVLARGAAAGGGAGGAGKLPPQFIGARIAPRHARFPLFVMTSGPVGMPTLPLAHYQHFLLFAGGIGVTPIASLHYALVNRFSIAERACAPVLLLERAGAALAGACRRGGDEHGGDEHGEAVAVRTLVSVWAVRDPPLLAMFKHSLATEPAGVAPPSSSASDGKHGSSDTYAGSGGGDVEAIEGADSGAMISTLVYQTGEKAAAGSGKGGGGAILAPGFHLRGGRPDVMGVVREAVQRIAAAADREEARGGWGALAGAAAAGLGADDGGGEEQEAAASPSAATPPAPTPHDAPSVAPIRIACVVCGPQPLVDDVYRAAAAHAQTFSRVEVHVHKELFAF